MMAAWRVAASIRIPAPAGAWFARHPEWWILATGLGAWMILALAPWQQLSLLCSGAGFTATTPNLSDLLALQSSAPFTGEFIPYVVMIMAMMSPLVILPVRHVAFRSFRRRRHYAIADFLAGYFGVWILAGAALFAMLPSLHSLDFRDRTLIAVSSYVVAIAWQLTSWKRVALWRCHRTAGLAPEGWQADAACLRFGITIGASCLASCWALMALPALTAHGLGSMGCIEAAMIHERYQQRLRPRIGLSIVLLLAALLLELRATLV